jgi:RHS repeat-associated protein
MQSLNLPQPTGYFSLSLNTYLRRVLLLTLLIFLSASFNTAAGQAPNIQFNKKSVDGGDRGSVRVNPSTLALELEIPLASYPGRAGLNVPVTLSYSSKAWRVEYIAYIPGHFSSSGNPLNDGYTRVEARFGEYSAGGWTSSIGFPVLDNTLLSEFYDGAGNSKSTGGCFGSNNPTGLDAFCYKVDRMLVRMPDGSTHELRSSDQPFDPVNHVDATDLYAVDGSGMRYNRTDQILYMSDGSRYLLTTGDYVDRNGNRLHYTGSGWTDTLGRTINPPPLANAPGTYTYSPPGMSGQYTFVWKRLGDPGVLTTTQPLKNVADTGCPIGNGSFSSHLFVSDVFNSRTCIQNADQVFNPVVLYQIQLPTGRSYTFTYNEYGEIDKVVLPTGGYERYEHALASQLNSFRAPYTQANRGVINRFVSTGAAGAAEDHWSYTPSSGKVSVTAPDNTLTERYMFMDISGICGWGYCPNTARAGKIYEERVYSAPENNVRHMLRRTLTDWAMTGSNATGTPSAPDATRNARVTKEVVILLDTDGDAQAKTTEYGYNLSNQFTTGPNQTSVSEYDYVPVAQSTAQTAAIGSIPRASLPLRTTETAYLDDDPAYRAQNILGLPTLVTVKSGSATVVAKTAMFYDEPDYQLGNTYGAVTGWAAPTGPRANVTTVRRYLDVNASVAVGQSCPAGVCVDTHDQYDQSGSIVKDVDALGNETLTAYSPLYAYAYPTSVTTPAPNPTFEYGHSAGYFGSTTGFTTLTAYDPDTGKVTAVTDANDNTTAYDYTDPLGRLKRVDYPDGGRTTYNYDDQNPCGATVETRTLLDDTGRETASWQYLDGLGRLYVSVIYEGQDASKPYLRTDAVYDTMGRVSQTSSQYRAAGCGGADPSRQWTTTEYDALSRVSKVTTPDGARVRRAYNGQYALVADPLNKQRVSKTDALGRLTDVWELKAEDPQNPDAELGPVPSVTAPDVPPVTTGYQTSYTYDTLGNLKEIAQGVQPHRFFNYDAFSRLTSAGNPESGAVNYTYDSNGNLSTKTDARGVTSTYTYDHLNRNIITTYSGGGTMTPDVRRFYDSAVNGKGVLSRSEAVGVSASEYVSYDGMGRLTQSRQAFWANNAWGQWFPASLAYNKGGSVVSQTYPSDHTVTYNYDAAGRLGDSGALPAFSGNIGDGVARTYASEIRYHQFGGMEQERFGTTTPLYHKSLYNMRGQLGEIRLGTAALPDTGWQRGAIINHFSASGWGASGGGSDNNGNLRGQDIFIPNIDGPGYDQSGNWESATQSFFYDALNRLTTASEASASSWTQNYVYDRWGNRTIKPNSSNAPAPQFSVTTATNRLGVPSGQSGRMDYDAAGNLINDNYSPMAYGSAAGAQTRFYDAENRMTSAQLNVTQSAAYAYDADGRRVKRNNGSGEVWQVYGAAGELLAEYAANASRTQPQKEYGYRNGELLVTVSAAAAGWGPTPVLNDNPLVALQTVIQARHITELRDAIDALRAHVGLAGYSWQTSAAPGLPITAGPISEMRTALDQALGAPSGGYSAGLAQGQPVKAVHIQELRDRVLNAWQTGSGVADIRWLVADQLGTPRMVVDQTGSLAGVSRHDYFPFGEEVAAGGNWRSPAHGYGATDNIRQQFTSKERDDETGLDYFEARYFSSAMGRFTSPDEFRGGPDELYDFADDASDNPTFYADLTNPQSLNKYQYAYNNPLRYVDPDGHEPDGQQQQKYPDRPPICAPDYCSPEVEAQRYREWLERVRRINEANEKFDENGVAKENYIPDTPKDLPGATQPCSAENPCPTTPAAPQGAKDHKDNARPSTREDHEEGKARKKRDRGGEKGDRNRRPPRKPHKDHVGPWPPQPFKPDPKNPDKKPRKNPCPGCRPEIPHIEPKKPLVKK